MGMWSSYKKRIIPSQIFVVMCTLLFGIVTSRWDWQSLLMVFCVLEFFSLLGAWSGSRMERIAEQEKARAKAREEEVEALRKGVGR